MSRRGLIGLVAAFLLAAAAYWVYENLEWEEVRVPGQPKGEAASNDLFAAQRLLTTLGATATTSRGFEGVPKGDPRRSVLVFPTPRRTLTPGQRARLLDWVAAGGHLVVVTYTIEGEGEATDPLLDGLGIRQKWRKDAQQAADQTDFEDAPGPVPQRKGPPRDPTGKSGPAARPGMPPLPARDRTCPAQYETGPLAPRFPAAALQVCFDPVFRLESTATPVWTVNSAHGAHALAIAHGQGRVTVLTDYDFMQNAHIGVADHADFLVALLGPSLAGVQVTLISREQVASLLQLIWQHGRAVLAVFVLLILALLWRAGSRFGPLVPRTDAVRRSLLEHVHASGEFLWRNGEARRLWKSALEATRRRVARMLPPTRDPDQLYAQLAAHTAIDIDRVRQAFHPTPHPRADEFTRAIVTLEHIRKSL